MSMFSEVFGLFKAVARDLGNLLATYPKKKRFSARASGSKPSLRDASSYEPWDFLSKEQWQEIYDGKKSPEDFTTIHSWPPQLDESEVTNKEEVTVEGVNEESEGGQKEESTEEKGEETSGNEKSVECSGEKPDSISEDTAEDAEPGPANSNESIDSYENSVSEPDLGGDFDTPESDSGGDSGSADSGGNPDAGDFDSGFDSSCDGYVE